MLSKSKGQVLRVAASLHVLFQLEADEEHGDDFVITVENDTEITEGAIKASINFVTMCCQQTAFIAGRGEEIKIIKASMTIM